MAKRTAHRGHPGAYDSLIDAERDALLQSGRKVGRGDLIKALLGASDLSPREARRAVDGFIDRRGGFIPSTSSTDEARTGWIDDLLDAERARAARDDRPTNRQTLIQAVRQASELSPREVRAAVEDYLYRRGGRTPTAGGWRFILLVAVGLMILAAACIWLWTHQSQVKPDA